MDVLHAIAIARRSRFLALLFHFSRFVLSFCQVQTVPPCAFLTFFQRPPLGPAVPSHPSFRRCSARRNEFMPGTKHRLVTLAGPPLAVNMARFLIMRKIQTEKEKL